VFDEHTETLAPPLCEPVSREVAGAASTTEDGAALSHFDHPFYSAPFVDDDAE
jgi:hypothetical protein